MQLVAGQLERDHVIGLGMQDSLDDGSPTFPAAAARRPEARSISAASARRGLAVGSGDASQGPVGRGRAVATRAPPLPDRECRPACFLQQWRGRPPSRRCDDQLVRGEGSSPRRASRTVARGSPAPGPVALTFPPLVDHGDLRSDPSGRRRAKPETPMPATPRSIRSVAVRSASASQSGDLTCRPPTRRRTHRGRTRRTCRR